MKFWSAVFERSKNQPLENSGRRNGIIEASEKEKKIKVFNFGSKSKTIEILIKKSQFMVEDNENLVSEDFVKRI